MKITQSNDMKRSSGMLPAVQQVAGSYIFQPCHNEGYVQDAK